LVFYMGQMRFYGAVGFLWSS